MTKTLVQHARVRTNTIKDSICKIDVPVVKFSDLWDNYVTGAPFKPGPDDKADYSNQCALRMSATFHKVGIKMLSFSQKTVKPMPGARTLGRVIMDGFPAAVRAYELGEWLKLQPFCGLPKQPENVTGKDWESKVGGAHRDHHVSCLLGARHGFDWTGKWRSYRPMEREALNNSGRRRFHCRGGAMDRHSQRPYSRHVNWLLGLA